MTNGTIDIDNVIPRKNYATKFKLRREPFHKRILPVQSVKKVDRKEIKIKKISKKLKLSYQI